MVDTFLVKGRVQIGFLSFTAAFENGRNLAAPTSIGHTTIFSGFGIVVTFVLWDFSYNNLYIILLLRFVKFCYIANTKIPKQKVTAISNPEKCLKYPVDPFLSKQKLKVRKSRT